jgi:hypothetical protein
MAVVGVARRRPATVDTSDPVSSGVMVGLTVFILGTLGVLYVVNSQDASFLSAPGSDASVQPTADSTVPVVPDDEGSAAAGQDTDRDGDTAADSESGLDGAASGGDASDGDVSGDAGGASERSTAPGVAPPAPDAADGTGTTAPEGADGRGLSSPDDPGRIPAITVSSTPRDVRTVHVDLNGDGVDERVWAAIVRDQVQTRVERVVDGTWTPRDTHLGAAADRLVVLQARDLTGDGRPEIYTRQWVATEGGSLTVWAYRDGDLARMRMAGGCYNDSNTVGITGALVEDVNRDGATIAAICWDEGLPPQQWPSAMYVWRDGRWDFDGMQGAYP